MPRASNTDDRRAQITAALRRVMARHGYDGASVALVAREAKLAPGLVHYHFTSKLEILLELVDALVAEHGARVSARLERAGDDPRARLEAFIDAHVATGKDADADALACWVAITAEALREPRVARRFEVATRALLAPLEGIVADGVRAGAFATRDGKAAAAALFATIQGYYVLAAAARSLIPRGSAAKAMRLMAEGLLGAVPRPSKRAGRRSS